MPSCRSVVSMLLLLLCNLSWSIPMDCLRLVVSKDFASSGSTFTFPKTRHWSNFVRGSQTGWKPLGWEIGANRIMRSLGASHCSSQWLRQKHEKARVGSNAERMGHFQRLIIRGSLQTTKKRNERTVRQNCLSSFLAIKLSVVVPTIAQCTGL